MPYQPFSPIHCQARGPNAGLIIPHALRAVCYMRLVRLTWPPEALGEQCKASWMKGYCAKTCGTCSIGSVVPPAPSVGAPPLGSSLPPPPKASYSPPAIPSPPPPVPVPDPSPPPPECPDIPPPGNSYTCVQQQGWGKVRAPSLSSASRPPFSASLGVFLLRFSTPLFCSL